MTLREQDFWDMMKNRLINRRESIRRNYDKQLADIDRKLRELEAWKNDMMRTLENGEPEPSPQASAEGRIPISSLVDAYVRETGRTEFTAADIKNYIQASGYPVSKHTYNSVRNTLDTRVQRGLMTRESGKYKVKEAG